jgi:hypothetical protein
MIAQLIEGLPWADYAVEGWLGSSALHAFPGMSLEGFAAEYLVTAYDDNSKTKATAAMTNGTELDKMLTAGVYDRTGIEIRTKAIDYRTKDGKAWRDERLAAGKTIIHEDDIKALDATLPRVREVLACYSDAPKFQVTLRGEIAGLQVQTRPDIVIGNRIPDLKYINSDAFDKFDRQFPSSRYVFQAGLAFGLGRETGIDDPCPSFLLAESGTIHPRIHVVELSEDDALWCWRKTVKRVEEIAAAINSDLGMIDQVKFRPLMLPAWARNED